MGTKKEMWQIWKDGFISAIPWRMKTPLGIMSYKRKRDAEDVRDEYKEKVSPIRWNGSGFEVKD